MPSLITIEIPVPAPPAPAIGGVGGADLGGRGTTTGRRDSSSSRRRGIRRCSSCRRRYLSVSGGTELCPACRPASPAETVTETTTKTSSGGGSAGAPAEAAVAAAVGLPPGGDRRRRDTGGVGGVVDRRRSGGDDDLATTSMDRPRAGAGPERESDCGNGESSSDFRALPADRSSTHPVRTTMTVTEVCPSVPSGGATASAPAVCSAGGGTDDGGEDGGRQGPLRPSDERSRPAVGATRAGGGVAAASSVTPDGCGGGGDCTRNFSDADDEPATTEERLHDDDDDGDDDARPARHADDGCGPSHPDASSTATGERVSSGGSVGRSGVVVASDPPQPDDSVSSGRRGCCVNDYSAERSEAAAAAEDLVGPAESGAEGEEVREGGEEDVVIDLLSSSGSEDEGGEGDPGGDDRGDWDATMQDEVASDGGDGVEFIDDEDAAEVPPEKRRRIDGGETSRPPRPPPTATDGGWGEGGSGRRIASGDGGGQGVRTARPPCNEAAASNEHGGAAAATTEEVETGGANNNGTMLDVAYECLACGSSLSHIRSVKGRLLHLKRCSRRHGITAGVVRQDTEHEAFIADDAANGGGGGKVHGADDAVASSREKENAVGVNAASRRDREAAVGNDDVVANPYEERWHAGADIDLALAGEADGIGGVEAPSSPRRGEAAASSNDDPPPTPSSSGGVTREKQQCVLTNFFRRPVRSLNNALLAGARRLAKSEGPSSSKKGTAAPAVTSAAASGRHQRQGGTAGGKRGRGGWGNRRDYSKAPCPLYKRITGTDFICDGFYYAKPSLSTSYFLSHFHSDHYGGITKTWSAGIIYCSLPTANLVHQQLGVNKRYLHPLGLGTPTVVKTGGGRPVTVTLLDANHCPGAVMFLFEVGNRHILHVGDFRWNREVMLTQQPPSPLRAFADLRVRLDELFLDTTYCDEKYAALPTQEEAIDAAFDVVRKETEEGRGRGTRTLFLFGSYTIGKERIYLSIAERLGVRVYVDFRRYRILSALNWPAERMRLLTTNMSESNLWVVPLGHINFKQMKEYVDGSTGKVFSAGYGRVVGFRPTGWTFSACRDGRLVTGRTSGRCSVYGVPYSEHSSYSELVDCLACLKPKKITPTVSASKSAEQVDLLLRSVRKREHGIEP